MDSILEGMENIYRQIQSEETFPSEIVAVIEREKKRLLDEYNKLRAAKNNVQNTEQDDLSKK